MNIDVEELRGLMKKTEGLPHYHPLCAMYLMQVLLAMPELLEAYETLEALRWADKRRSMAGCCDDCPVMPSCLHEVNYAWCETLIKHEQEWLTAYRKEPERQKIANAIDEASDALGRVIDGRLERARKEQET